jgi:hypothetical protein
VESLQHALPNISDRVLMSTNMVSKDTTRERSPFKIVCEECGSLSIKIIDLTNLPETAQVQCGRCSAVRGTLADLHALARRGVDLFEF